MFQKIQILVKHKIKNWQELLFELYVFIYIDGNGVTDASWSYWDQSQTS